MSNIRDEYTIKNHYNADTLVIGNLEKINSSMENEFSPSRRRYKNKFIFELIKINGSYKYREIFTGFITDDEYDHFDHPYIVNPVPLTSSYKEYKGINISTGVIGKLVREINREDNKTLKKVNR